MRGVGPGRLGGLWLVPAAALWGALGAAAKADAATPAQATIALTRRIVHSLAQAPAAARLSLPVEHQLLLAAVGAFLATAAGIEASARRRKGRRKGRSSRASARARAATLDVASAAGTRTITLERAHAHAVEDPDGRLLAQVVWSHDLGWCAQASWPHLLYGPEGLPRSTAPLPDGDWLHVAGVGLRLHAGTVRESASRHARPLARAL